MALGMARTAIETLTQIAVDKQLQRPDLEHEPSVSRKPDVRELSGPQTLDSVTDTSDS